MTAAEDVARLRTAWQDAGLAEAVMAPLEGMDTEEAVAYLRANVEDLTAPVGPAYDALVVQAKELGRGPLRSVRNKVDARARGKGTVAAWAELQAAERKRDSLSRVLVSLRRLAALPDTIPGPENAVARTMERHARLW